MAAELVELEGGLFFLPDMKALDEGIVKGSLDGGTMSSCGHHEVMCQVRSLHGFRDCHPQQCREICRLVAWTAAEQPDHIGASPAGHLTVSNSQRSKLSFCHYMADLYENGISQLKSNYFPEQLQLFSTKRLVSFIRHRLLKSTRFSLEYHHILNIYCITLEENLNSHGTSLILCLKHTTPLHFEMLMIPLLF